MTKGHRRNPPRVGVAGQIPPPMPGQFIMVSEILDELREDSRIVVEHIPFRFTRTPGDQGTKRPGKLIEVLSVWTRAIRGMTRGRYDVILYPLGGTAFAPLLRDILVLPVFRIASRKLVLHFHGGGHASVRWNGKLNLRTIAGLIYRTADMAVVMTPYNRRDPQALGIKRIEVLPHRLPDRFDGGLGGERKRAQKFLYIGQVRPEKGFPELLEAIAGIAVSEPSIRLLVAGEPIAPFGKDWLTEEARRLGIEDQVRLLGPVRGKAKWSAFAEADLLIFPTRAKSESFGLVLVEAMMWGLPIVMTDWRGNTEVTGLEGTVTFPVNEDFSGELRSAIDRALANRSLWAEWGASNRRRFEENFSRDGHGRRLADILLDVACS